MAQYYCSQHNCTVSQQDCPHCGEKHTTEVEKYAKPDMGERVRESDQPLGWITDYVDAPDDWSVEFVERGGCLRYRATQIDRSKFDIRTGWAGVGITSGNDYWHVGADSNKMLRDLWFDPREDSLQALLTAVESSIEVVQNDLERCRLSKLLDGAVPESVVENLIGQFGTVERVAEIENDTPVLESVDGVGPNRREAIQDRFIILKMSDKELVSP
jgi:hypothetical protein